MSALLFLSVQLEFVVSSILRMKDPIKIGQAKYVFK